jgi:hypothetical protein
MIGARRPQCSELLELFRVDELQDFRRVVEVPYFALVACDLAAQQRHQSRCDLPPLRLVQHLLVLNATKRFSDIVFRQPVGRTLQNCQRRFVTFP